MELDGRLEISRWTSNREPYEGIRIRIEDRTSGVTFLESEITMEQLAQLVTGSSRGQEIKMQMRGLDYIGKTREYVKATVFISDADYKKHGSGTYEKSKEGLAKWLKANHAREGWLMDTYLGSQGSVSFAAGGQNLNYGYFRYVDKS